MGAFGRTYFFVSNTDKSSFPIAEDLAFFENVTENNCVVFEMGRSVFDIHIVRENGGLVLFGLESDLDEFLLDYPAKDVVVFVQVVNFPDS